MHHMIAFAEQGSDIDPEGEFVKLDGDNEVFALVEIGQAHVFADVYLDEVRKLVALLNDKHEREHGDRPYLTVPVSVEPKVAPYDRELLWRENGRSVSASA